MSKISFLLITGLCATLGASLSASAEEEVFRSISDNGTVEFSDQSNGTSSAAFQISTPVVVSSPNRSFELSEFYEGTETAPVAKVSPPTSYTDFQILTPVNNQGGWFGGVVPVKVALSPRLKDGHEVVIELNGAEVAVGEQLSFELPKVDRGLHTLQVSVRDKSIGATLKTETVSFQVHRRSGTSNTRMLHPSLQPVIVVNPSDINEILAE